MSEETIVTRLLRTVGENRNRVLYGLRNRGQRPGSQRRQRGETCACNPPPHAGFTASTRRRT